MDTTPHRQRPADLVRAQQRFQAWRTQRTPGTRIPQELWDLAVPLARTHGLSRTAATLRLDYYGLKKRLEADSSSDQPNHPPFVELTPPLLLARQCHLELNNGSGVTLRIQLVGYDAADIEALARGFGDAL